MKTHTSRTAGLSFALSFSLTAAALLGLSGQAQAAPPAQKSRVVTTYDLNLNTTAGQAALHARVRRAAERLCIDPADRRISSRPLGKTCIAKVVAAAGPQIEGAVQRDRAAVSASLAAPAQP